tara:strand:- start:22665 stop:22838 length:174 start_codon:yes stop_codon:yes gene_type:complete
MSYKIVYVPKVQDEIVVAEFDTLDKANSHMSLIKETKQKSFPFHYILYKGKQLQCAV